jgi:hypothetical protein
LIGFVTLPFLQADVTSADEALGIVVGKILNHDTAGKRVIVHPDRLPEGTAIPTWRDRTAMVTPAEGYVVFIDDTAMANFEHPCRYVFVHGETGSPTVEPAMTPPAGAEEWVEMETEAFRILKASKNVRARRLEHPFTGGRSARGGELYAVLMSGGAAQYSNYPRYWNDLSNIYITLVDVYGYKDENIIVLCSDGLNPAADQSNGLNSPPDLDGDGDDDIMYPCLKTDIENVFAQLKTTLSKDDQLFVFSTDHGGSVSGWDVYLNLWNSQSLYDYELAAMYDALPPLNIVTTMEQCFSGGFMDDLSGSDRVFSSAASYDEYSWAMPPNYEYDTYVFYWTAAVKGEDAYGVPCNADLNGDELISMREAFLYAEANDISQETPQYESTPVTLGEEMTLFGTGKTYYIPGDFTTIQGAIDAMESNDRVIVSAGTYVENLDFKGKDVTVEGVDGAGATILDGGQAGSVAVFMNGETEKAVIRGFTLRNGRDALHGGGGIYCSGASPTFERCLFTQNGAPSAGGGGVMCEAGSHTTFINCAILGNTAEIGGGYYGTGSHSTFYNCTVADNTAASAGGGLYCAISSAPKMYNSIVWGNAPNAISAAGITTLKSCDVEGGFPGTCIMDLDPLFSSCPELAPQSPCVDMGDTAMAPEELDLVGNERVFNASVDLGACEAYDIVLEADHFSLDPRKAKVIGFDLDFGPGFAGRTYVMAGSVTGRMPGMVVNGTTIPLNFDPYTDLVLGNLNTGVFAGFAGTLDAGGAAQPTMNWPGGGSLAWVGIEIHHAAFTMSPIDASSNPVSLILVSDD